MIHHYDGLGRLIQVDEVVKLTDQGEPSGNTNAWTTRYEYDLNDQLTRITDSQNNIKTFAYDGLKRKIGMNDPDRGIMQFAYDDASNLIETTDAKVQRISYRYDGANRISSETYHDGQSQPPWRLSGDGLTNSVVYHYDAPYPNLPQGDNTSVTARNVKGALTWVEDLSGEEHTSYDARGRVEWIVKRMPDPVTLSHNPNHASLVSYRTAFGYDSLDRITTLTYPDADYLRYEYNDRNLLDRILGGPTGNIVSNRVYQPSAQNAQIHYGNGVHTSYAYDSRLRLKELLTVNNGPSRELVHFGYEFDGASNIKSISDLRPDSAVPQGDPRRNTQIFEYDDLYRLTRVQYSFELPGQAKRDDGFINYGYDRIGNMLHQSSSLTNQIEKGLPIANLGEMESGGRASGRWDRMGRGASDPPGPHALTKIQNLRFPTRNYAYDANGNMTNIDGLICTWDFKDRLIRVENTEMAAEYKYDFTDHRVFKSVAYEPGSANAVNHDSRITALYVNKYFEIREHDVPTKYVWNGNTRVARVNGSLNTNLRVQRLRVFPGRNLLSLAVTATNAFQQLSDSQPATLDSEFAFRWNAATKDWSLISPKDTLPAGSVIWLKAITNASLTISGEYVLPTNRTITADGQFLASAGLEEWNLKSAISDLPFASAWTYEAVSDRWVVRMPLPLETQSDLCLFIGPGAAIFVRAADPAQLEVPKAALRIRYYHEDHATSTANVSDTDGNVQAEVSYYPFGRMRHRIDQTDRPESYLFVGTENDEESDLELHEARYFISGLARFSKVDVFSITVAGRVPDRPQGLNPYTYSQGQPICFADKNGYERRRIVGPADAAALSQAAYDAGKFSDLERVTLNNRTWIVGGTFVSKSGLKAVLFLDSKGANGTDAVLAFAGTELTWGSGAQDVATDLGQASGLMVPAQYQEGRAIAQSLKQAFPRIQVVGHSLGGGISQYVSATEGIGGVGVNSAGLVGWTRVFAAWNALDNGGEFLHIRSSKDVVSKVGWQYGFEYTIPDRNVGHLSSHYIEHMRELLRPPNNAKLGGD